MTITNAWLHGACLVLAFAGCGGQESKTTPTAPQGDPVHDFWISREAVEQLPMEGKAWESLAAFAKRPVKTPKIADQDDMTDVCVLAKALVFVRTGEESLRTEVTQACLAAIGTEDGGRTLALGRNLVGYVIAADLVKLPEDAGRRFREWLKTIRKVKLDGRTLISTHEDRPNNWGTHAGAARVAVAAYLGDREDLTRAAKVLRGWLGDRDSYAGFKYKGLSWQADATEPVGVNPAGSRRRGHSIGGVLPDDQRRGGKFSWPPPKENYVYEALQGALVQAVILESVGELPWEWSDRALLRAFKWLHEEADYPAEGDDTWQTHLINHVYGAEFPALAPSRPGKNVGFTDWTHAGSRSR